MMSLSNFEIIESIKRLLRDCLLCEGLDRSGGLCLGKKEIGLNYMYPLEIPIKILFVAESPPKPGNGFFYDETSKKTIFRETVFDLINSAGLGPVKSLSEFNGKGYYLADAMNCRWDKGKSQNLRKGIFLNCSKFLEQQMNLLKPHSIVAMGVKARNSLKFENVARRIQALGLLPNNMVEISFPLGVRRYKKETQAERVEGLRKICLK
jgi:hypothetical protein